MAHPAAPLLPEPLVVRGHLVTFDNGTVIEDGALYIDVNGVIQGVAPRASAPPAGTACDGPGTVRAAGAPCWPLRERRR